MVQVAAAAEAGLQVPHSRGIGTRLTAPLHKEMSEDAVHYGVADLGMIQRVDERIDAGGCFSH